VVTSPLLAHRAGRYYASSASEPDRLHCVTGYSCDCRGFITHQRCKYHAALLAALGWLTDEFELDPPATPWSPRGECGGMAEVQDFEVRQFCRFVKQWTACRTGDGTSNRAMPAAADDRKVA